MVDLDLIEKSKSRRTSTYMENVSHLLIKLVEEHGVCELDLEVLQVNLPLAGARLALAVASSGRLS